MPNCVQFFRKSDNSREAIVLNRLDEEICAHMGLPVHPTEWCCGWSNIQLEAAMGKTLEQICEHYKAELKEYKKENLSTVWLENMVKISQYLSENFTTDSWAER